MVGLGSTSLLTVLFGVAPDLVGFVPLLKVCVVAVLVELCWSTKSTCKDGTWFLLIFILLIPLSGYSSSPISPMGC